MALGGLAGAFHVIFRVTEALEKREVSVPEEVLKDRICANDKYDP